MRVRLDLWLPVVSGEVKLRPWLGKMCMGVGDFSRWEEPEGLVEIGDCGGEKR